MLPLQMAWIQPLVRELRSCKLRDLAKKKIYCGSKIDSGTHLQTQAQAGEKGCNLEPQA